ncbi:MAG: NAD-dependent deacylase [Leptospiraceae bacterium]|nr:NAD-dependent deacylase [Leptospiraceae bacterium]MCP5498790.1 NAD-dependent deacylase [Leptospiraceae bacterium]
MFEKKMIEVLKSAQRVAVLTGAGISSESGIPTFRGKGGYWKNYKAEELATPEAFNRDPALVWSWYGMRREVCHKAQPNPAHYILARMEEYYPNFLLITQNVDGLHRRAGNAKIVEIHGNIFHAKCKICDWKDEFLEIPLKKEIPNCPVCASIIRPDIVWFGETYDDQKLIQSQSFLAKADCILVIGTSALISVPVRLAMFSIAQGAYSIELNPDSTSLSDRVDVSIRGKAGEILPEIWKDVQA